MKAFSLEKYIRLSVVAVNTTCSVTMPIHNIFRFMSDQLEVFFLLDCLIFRLCSLWLKVQFIPTYC